MYYVIQGIGILGAIIAFIAYQQKEHKRIVICRGLCDFTFTVHWALQSAWVGAAMGVVCVIKDLTLAFAVEKGKRVKLWTAIICVLYVAMGTVSIIFSTDGIAIGILLIAANINGTIAYSIKNEIVMRIVDFPTEVIWLVYNSLALSFGGIICQSFIIVSIIIALVKHFVQKRRRAKEISATETEADIQTNTDTENGEAD